MAGENCKTVAAPKPAVGARRSRAGSLREHSAQVMNLALQIADSEVRVMMEAYCDDGEVIDGRAWMNVQNSASDLDSARAIALATRYIGLRSPDAFPWRFIRHPDRPELVCFEDKP